MHNQKCYKTISHGHFGNMLESGNVGVQDSFQGEAGVLRLRNRDGRDDRICG